MALALYIHWPFCKAKCPYCDFNSHVRGAVDEPRWQAALLAELRYMAQWMPGERLSSIFFGGGTPSLMPPGMVAALIDEAVRLFAVDEPIEITLEANPTSVEAARFASFREAGINRVSLGVQSLREEALRFLGREHSAVEALSAVELAACTFERYSFDLIYARPQQSAAEWETELREALAYADKHLSLYQLTIEPNTAFHHAYHRKKAFALPKDTLAEELFLITQQVMEQGGLPAYEISNHAAPGEESRHNHTYWRGDAYLGVGPGAHGRVAPVIPDIGESGANAPVRSLDRESVAISGERLDSRFRGNDGPVWYATQTLKSPERWLEHVQQHGHGLEVCEPISPIERAEEQLLTGLRLREGIRLTADIEALLNQKKVAFYCAEGLLQSGDNRLIATPKGWLVLNRLLAEMVV